MRELVRSLLLVAPTHVGGLSTTHSSSTHANHAYTRRIPHPHLFTAYDHAELQLPAVLAALAERAQTKPGHHACMHPQLARDADHATQVYSAVAEAMESAAPPLGHRLDVDAALRAAATGALLDVGALAYMAEALAALSALARWGERDEQQCTPSLARLARDARPPPRLSRLEGVFEPIPSDESAAWCAVEEGDDEEGGNDAAGDSACEPSAWRLSSEALPLLAAKRAHAARCQREVRAEFDRLLRRDDITAAMVMPTPVWRKGRAVIAVAAESAKRHGVMVARSRSGSTVFVEPHDVRPAAKRARAAEHAIAAAEARYLRAFSSLAGAHAAAFEVALLAAAEADAVVARARLGLDWGGVVPTVGARGAISICGAVHPLLALAAAAGDDAPPTVGNDVMLGLGLQEEEDAVVGAAADDECGGAQGLLLSGPNGGGKTALLKTIGLAALLARLALPIPCKSVPTPRVDFFDEVLTDMGDRQSVEEGASTYAAHLRACLRMLSAAASAAARDSHALLLLDEPGVGTEPSQGAAVSRAVVEELLSRGARLVATTHSAPLKRYALLEPKLAVGAMLRGPRGEPTYELVLGAVGESHALDLAIREGLPDSLVERARALLPAEDEPETAARVEVEALVESLRVARERARVSAAAAELERARAAAAHEEARALARSTARQLERARAWLDRRIARIDQMVRRMRSSGAPDLELLGSTLDSLQLAQRDAGEARRQALATLGLSPLPDETALEEGSQVMLEAEGEVLEGTVTEACERGAPTVHVSIMGAPAVPLPRGELAVYGGDFYSGAA